MYYLLIRNLDLIRCIDSSKVDAYRDGDQFPCSVSLNFEEGDFVREVMIRCADQPGLLLKAKVFKAK